jgi:hypothetical protein
VFSAAGFSREEGLTLELALRIHEPFEKKFQFIVEFETGDERSHLMVGQWEDEIIVLQGDDYGSSELKLRVACRVDRERAVLVLTIVSNERGTKLYVNGKTIRRENPRRGWLDRNSALVERLNPVPAKAKMPRGLRGRAGHSPWNMQVATGGHLNIFVVVDLRFLLVDWAVRSHVLVGAIA